MNRKLVLCSDGTGNSGGKARGTNVWRFYKAIDIAHASDQLTFYQDGVGTQAFKLFRLLGGAFGFGMPELKVLDKKFEKGLPLEQLVWAYRELSQKPLNEVIDDLKKQPDERLKAQAQASKVVWWRRVVYFLLLVSTLGTLLTIRRFGAMPLPLSENWTRHLEKLPASLSEYIVGFPEKWLYAFSGRWWFLATLVVIFSALLFFRSYLRKRTQYLGRAGWILTTGTPAVTPIERTLESISDIIKAGYASQNIRDFVREKVFPATVFSFAFLLVLLWLYNMLILPPNMDVCESEEKQFNPLPKGGAVFNDFHTCNPWYATGVSLKKGETYKVNVTQDNDWSDWHIPATANGFKHKTGLTHKLISFTKRYKQDHDATNQGWFKLIALFAKRTNFKA